MVAMNLNTPTYKLSGTTSSSSVTLSPQDTLCSSLVIFNSGTVPIFLVSGVTAPTAVYPTSATAPVNGKVVGPGVTATFTKNVGDGFISGITPSSTADTFISAGAGE